MSRHTSYDLILFDVNETLLDMGPLKKAINSFFEKEDAAALWFSKLLYYSLVDLSTKQYHNFSAIAGGVLDMLAAYYGKALPEGQKQDILAQMANLPPHPEVEEGLQLLKEAGFRLATLTNSAQEVADQQLVRAGIDHFFEKSLSVESMQLYKPDLTTYKRALALLDAQKESTLFVAAHGWDISGAVHADLPAAFIERKGKSLYPLAPKPHYQVPNLVALAKELRAG